MSSCPDGRLIHNSTEDSDSDCVQDGTSHKRQITNSFGKKKTSRYNRKPHKKSALTEREKAATRCSRCIKQIMKDKKELDEVY